MSKLFVGFDTSNYTTSVAVCDGDGEVLLNFKKMLAVKDGERGLRQSDAVFQHTVNMEDASAALREFLAGCDGEIYAVGCSAKPRDAEGSYMPCFLVGKSVSLCAASVLGCESYLFSHQAGHVAAALLGAGATHLFGKEFVSFHVSGGTTDILHVKSSVNGDMKIERVGGTRDLNAGQVIDRAGVMMGYPFPAGRHLEAAASENKDKFPKYRICVDGLECNLSGIENKSAELFEKTGDRGIVSAFVLNAVGETLSALTDNVSSALGDLPIVYAGGVMSCTLIKDMLKGGDRYFAPPEFSADNAAGIAYLTKLKSDARR